MIKHHLIAHRGWQHRYPENTLPAIAAAVQSGCSHVEIDIQLTADLVPMVCHDDELDRLCHSELNINRCTREQLNALSVYEPDRFDEQYLGTTFLTLADCVDFLKHHPKVTLYAEIKQESLREFGQATVVQILYPLLEAIVEQCVVISFDIPVLAAFKDRGWPRVAPVLSNWEQAFTPELGALQPSLLFCDVDLLSESRQAVDLPFPAAFYEVGNYSQARQLLAQGAALIETFNIGELISQDDQDANQTG